MQLIAHICTAWFFINLLALGVLLLRADMKEFRSWLSSRSSSGSSGRS